MIFKSPFARLGLLAWALATSATLAPRPLHGATAEYTSEILNLAGAPFELLSGPEGENGPNWGGLVSFSCYVHNLSERALSRVPLRVAMLPRTESDPTSYEWRAFTVDLGPARLAPGDTTYLLLTVPMPIRAGARRYLVAPGVDGRYGAREVGSLPLSSGPSRSGRCRPAASAGGACSSTSGPRGRPPARRFAAKLTQAVLPGSRGSIASPRALPSRCRRRPAPASPGSSLAARGESSC